GALFLGIVGVALWTASWPFAADQFQLSMCHSIPSSNTIFVTLRKCGPHWGRGFPPVWIFPWCPLLALAPALLGPVGPPRAAGFGRVLHLDAVLWAPAGGPALCIGRLYDQGEALQHRFQPCQQSAFVTVTQGQLHLAAAHLQVHVHTGRCLGKWWG